MVSRECLKYSLSCIRHGQIPGWEVCAKRRKGGETSAVAVRSPEFVHASSALPPLLPSRYRDSGGSTRATVRLGFKLPRRYDSISGTSVQEPHSIPAQISIVCRQGTDDRFRFAQHNEGALEPLAHFGSGSCWVLCSVLSPLSHTFPSFSRRASLVTNKMTDNTNLQTPFYRQ